MSQIYVPGPAYTFVGTGALQAFQFFGFTERGITISRNGLYEDIKVDYAGEMPADVSMLGQNARISGDFTQYNEQVAEACAAFLANSAPGTGGNFSIGTLMQLENGGFPLAIYSPYAVKTEFGSMTNIFYFYTTYLVDQYDVTLSVRRKAPRVSWRPIPKFGTYSGSVFQPGQPPFNAYQLYSDTLPPGITINELIALVN